MAYSDDISNLGADHHWDFDGDSLDQIGSVNGTDSGVIYTGPAIAKDATNCMTTNTQGSISVRGDYVTLPTTTEINNSAQTRKAVCGWFMFDSFRPPPIHIYGEGNTTTKWQFCAGFGNNVMFEVVEATNFPTGLQVYGPSMVPNRAYHLCGIFLGNTQGNEVKFFVDGVEMTNADPADRQPDTANLDARGVAVFGDPGTSSQGVGGGTVRSSSSDEGYYNHWATWGDEADADLTDTEIRETLFERGALADFTVSTGTEGAMQTALDAITDSQGNAPCCIEIEAVTGGGDFELTSEKTFDELASIHYRYNGTADELVIINTSGGDASIGSAPFGGTLTIKNRQTLTVTVQDAVTKAAISGARVYIEADTGGPETAGTVIMNTTTNGSGVATATYDWSADQPIIARVRKGSASTYYKTGALGGPLTSTPLDAVVLMVPDE